MEAGVSIMEALEIAAGMREIEQRDFAKGLRVRHVDEREVLKENGEIELPRTDVRLDVYPDPSGVVVELSRRLNGEPRTRLR